MPRSTTDIGPIISRFLQLGKPHLGYLGLKIPQLLQVFHAKMSSHPWPSQKIFRMQKKKNRHISRTSCCLFDYYKAFANLNNYKLFVIFIWWESNQIYGLKFLPECQKKSMTFPGSSKFHFPGFQVKSPPWMKI